MIHPRQDAITLQTVLTVVSLASGVRGGMGAPRNERFNESIPDSVTNSRAYERATLRGWG